MTNPTPHGQVPEALRLAHIFDNPLPPEWPDMVAAAEELRRQHTRIAELESELEAVGAGGVQALSAAPVAFLKSVIALCSHRGYSPANIELWNKDDKWIADLWRQAESMLTASPTPPAEQQAATKAAPGVGNTGFDHQTAADFLNGKTVSDEAVRKFVQASRWAHDERASLSATLLAMHGVLTSREAEVALLKKALLEAEAAPLPAPAPLNEREAFEAWIKKDGGDLGTFGTPPNMHYRNSAVNNAWVAWKARAALAAQGGKV